VLPATSPSARAQVEGSAEPSEQERPHNFAQYMSVIANRSTKAMGRETGRDRIRMKVESMISRGRLSRDSLTLCTLAA